MRNNLASLATAATVSVALVTMPQPTRAHGWRGGGAFLGGFAAGAIIGGALAAPRYYYGGPYYYGYYGGPYYYGYYRGPYAYAWCWRQRVWTHHGWRSQRFCR